MKKTKKLLFKITLLVVTLSMCVSFFAACAPKKKTNLLSSLNDYQTTNDTEKTSLSTTDIEKTSISTMHNENTSTSTAHTKETSTSETVNTIITSGMSTDQVSEAQDNEVLGAKYILNVCPPYQTYGYYTEKSYSLAGDSYINGFHLNDDYGGIAYFNLRGKYNTLSFDVGHIDGKKLKTGYYYFYLDGELVHTLTLDPSMLVQHIEIPLNGAMQMIIEGGSWCHCFALVNVKVS